MSRTPADRRGGLPLPLPPRQRRTAALAYTLMLRLYPAGFRRRYGADLTAAFLDLLAQARAERGVSGVVAALSRALADVVSSAARERLPALTNPFDTPPAAPPGGLQMWDEITQDTRQALRSLWYAPGYAAAAVLTLALGIGANSAIFSVGSDALLRSAPVPSPHTLAAVWTTCRAGNPRCSSSYPDYLDYRERSTLLDDLAAYSFPRASLRSDDGARSLQLQATTGNYFELLGTDMALGRAFTAEDERARRLVVVLSDRLWRDQFGADPGVIGGDMRLNNASYEIVGVTPPDFEGLHLGAGPDAFIPLLTLPVLDAGSYENTRFEERGSRWISQLVGRMTAGTTVEQVRTEMLAISEQLAAEDPEARGPRTVTVESAHRLIGPGNDDGELANFVFLLGGVVGFTLLLACANLANLLLARAAGRRREIGVRLALGASRWRIARQMLTESTVLALIGGSVGLLIGYWLVSLLGGYQLPGGVDIEGIGTGLNASVLGFTLALALGTGVAFGMAPALLATRVGLDAGMRSASRSVTAGSSTLRGVLVAAQLALCLVLLTGAGLFLQALWNGLDTDMGFPVDGLAVVAIDLSALQYGSEQGGALAEQLVARLEAQPGVTAAGIGTRAPMLPGGTATMLHGVDGYQAADDEELRLEFVFVSDGYLRALGLPLLAGQALPAAVADGQRLMVINRDMAERWWPNRNAVGSRVTFFGQEGGPGVQGEILGVVENTKWDDGIATDDYPFAYMPLATSSGWASGAVVVVARTTGNAADLLPTLRREIHAVEPNISIVTLATMDSLLNDVLMPQHLGSQLFTWFATLALLLAAVGIYSVLAYTVNQRRRDLGVRIALGAGRGRIIGMVLAGVAGPAAAGLLAGVVIARLLAGTVSSFMYGVDAADPWTVAAVGVGLVVVTLMAGWLPALRATRVEPTVALRSN